MTSIQKIVLDSLTHDPWIDTTKDVVTTIAKIQEILRSAGKDTSENLNEFAQLQGISFKGNIGPEIVTIPKEYFS